MPKRMSKGKPKVRYVSKAYQKYETAYAWHVFVVGLSNQLYISARREGFARRILNIQRTALPVRPEDCSIKPDEKKPYKRGTLRYPIPENWPKGLSFKSIQGQQCPKTQTTRALLNAAFLS